MSEQRTPEQKIYGWYDRPDQPVDMPTYDPPHDAPCPFCGGPITPTDIRTHSMLMEGSSRSFFYRSHRSCHQTADVMQQSAIDAVIWDSIKHHGDER